MSDISFEALPVADGHEETWAGGPGNTRWGGRGKGGWQDALEGCFQRQGLAAELEEKLRGPWKESQNLYAAFVHGQLAGACEFALVERALAREPQQALAPPLVERRARSKLWSPRPSWAWSGW